MLESGTIDDIDLPLSLGISPLPCNTRSIISTVSNVCGGIEVEVMEAVLGLWRLVLA